MTAKTFNELIKLVKETYTFDNVGNQISTLGNDRTVFARAESIGQSEFYKAATADFKPEVKFVLADYLDYQGEKLVKYTPYGGSEAVYSVLRNYRKGNELELVCERKLKNVESD